MIRTRIFVSDLGRRYSGVPARACSLYQEIYIYIYTRIAKVSRPRSKRRRKRSREVGGEECILVTGKSVVSKLVMGRGIDIRIHV